MPTPILMPALSPTMEKGNLAKWHVKEGDTISAGDIIAEIETDKATMEVEAVEEGTIAKLLVDEGTEDVPVNDTIAVLLEEGEDESALDDFEAPSAKSGGDDDKDKDKKSAEPKDDKQAKDKSGSDKDGGNAKEAKQKSGDGEASKKAEKSEKSASPAKSNGKDGRVFASPLARRLAEQNELDLSAIEGSGPHGRIVKRDIDEALESGSAKAGKDEKKAEKAEKADSGKAVAPADPDDLSAYFEKGSYDAIKLDKMRSTIARRLAQAKREIPHYYLTIDCEIDELLALRKKLNARTDDYKISVNDFIIRASALALKKVPDANASWAETHILRHHHADVSMAVAIEGGLITPIIRKADTKGLAEIALEAKDLAARARDRKLQPSEYEGGSFSISNLGMFGIRNFTAVINPPQAAIMAVGAGELRPVVRDGTLQTATMMTVTMSCDHRVIDGALGAELLAAFKGFIEEPLTMLL